MQHKQTAEEIIAAIGGKENVLSAAHCITRLRLALKDDCKINKKALEEIALVKGSFSTAGQFQIILGLGVVEKVFKEFIAIAGEQIAGNKDAVKEAGAKNLHPVQNLIKILSDVFIPIIPAIITAGLLMGINNLLTAKGMFIPNQTVIEAYPSFADLAAMINTFANTAFVFLPILISWSAAKRFGANQVLGIVLGALLVHPDLLNGWAYGQASMTGKIPYWNIFGLEIPKVGYQGSVLPSLFSVYAMSKVEKWLKKITPSYIELLVVPVFTIVISGVLAFTIIGPLTRELGNGIAWVMIWIFTNVPVLGALIYGAVFAPLVVTGMHYTFLAINIQLLAQTGTTFLWPIEALSNIAQASACAAMFFASKEVKTREVASAASISAYFGVTEPAMFGINLRYRSPFVCAMIGSACAALFITLNHAQATGIGVGGLPAVLSIQPAKMGVYLVGMLIAIIVPFVLTLIVAKQRKASAEV
ncbi:MAG: PTS system trehalose-specific EIIBC component [Negativicutes bacterium]